MSTERKTTTEDLLAQGRALVPWFLDVQVTPEVSTRDFTDVPYPDSFGRVMLTDPRDRFMSTLRKLYPEGLAGRSVLDCACNCGGFLFWARELGAGRCHGIDVREHWIEQANFLLANRAAPSEAITFELRDVYDLPAAGLEPFDVVVFYGIFYHLPEPITGLKAAADMTREVLIINTSTTIGIGDGQLAVSFESVRRPITGIYGLRWFPSGPQMLIRILAWLGFSEVRVNWWRLPPEDVVPGTGKLELIAARSAEALRSFDLADAERPPLQRMIENSVPPGATVLVAAPEGDKSLDVDARETVPFPTDGREAADDAELIAELIRRRGEGADYLLIPRASAPWLGQHRDLHKYIRKSYTRIAREEGVGVLFTLLPTWMM
jgi:2-polyprenyl-3-methyl-5-hydroxy-6-metoxy-1,4-benzoquinol methylase